MFVSNQELVLVGDNRNESVLRHTVELLLKGYGFKPKYYNHKDGKLYFYESAPQYKVSTVIESEDLNTDYIYNLIQLYLSSVQYKIALKSTYSEYEGADGSLKLGWKLTINNNSIFNIIVIEPFYCFYAK